MASGEPHEAYAHKAGSKVQKLINTRAEKNCIGQVIKLSFCTPILLL